MARYYDTDDQSYTVVPRRVVEGFDVSAFLAACGRRHGLTVAEQARALLLGRAPCESQNPNALNRIRGLAMERGQWPLAIALGAYFDGLAY